MPVLDHLTKAIETLEERERVKKSCAWDAYRSLEQAERRLTQLLRVDKNNGEARRALKAVRRAKNYCHLAQGSADGMTCPRCSGSGEYRYASSVPRRGLRRLISVIYRLIDRQGSTCDYVYLTKKCERCRGKGIVVRRSPNSCEATP